MWLSGLCFTAVTKLDDSLNKKRKGLLKKKYMNSSLKLGLTQKLTQSLRMTPEMRLAIKVLQLNSVELKNQINEILENNPVIEIDEQKTATNNVSLEKVTDEAAESAIPSKEFKEQSREDFGIDWQSYLRDADNSEFKVSQGYNSDQDETSFENFVSHKSDLRDHLMMQLHEVDFNPSEKKIGEYIVGLIDRKGYLRYSAEQISQMLKVETGVVDKVIKTVQTMEPTGVGAQDLKQCLLLQATEEGYKDDAVTVIISQYLDELAKNKIAHIVKSTGYELEEINAAVEVIKSLNPVPGAQFPGYSDEIYITPDVFIEKVDQQYVVTINESDLPVLRINKVYKEALKNSQSTEKEVCDFIKNRLESARAFLQHVDKRKQTIVKVTEAICSVQKDFFDYGVMHLRPLTLQDVAEMTDLHESTISRATSGKYAQTPSGLFELKFFFTGAVRTQSGEDMSTLTVKNRIKKLVFEENPAKPLSDSKIVSILKDEGIELARRTVAKYRTELNIPSSSIRKRG